MYKINEKKCLGEKCGKCAQVCPVGAISLDSQTKKMVIDQNICIGCGTCKMICPNSAISELK